MSFGVEVREGGSCNVELYQRYKGYRAECKLTRENVRHRAKVTSCVSVVSYPKLQACWIAKAWKKGRDINFSKIKIISKE